MPWLEAAVYDGPFALKCFERAACLAPGNPAVLHNLIIELTRSGKGSDAEVSPRQRKLDFPVREDHAGVSLFSRRSADISV